ncbi:MAG TPA: methyltransferase [Clostridia bacterium]|nr:methyltransferase [Clostridia bacterium]
MPDHYFTQSPASAEDRIDFEHVDQGHTLRFVTDAGVFSREHMDKGTLLLLDALPPCSGRALDLGCGWGGLGICYLRRNPGLTLIQADINERAVALTRENLARNGLSAEVVQSDGLENVPGSFDLIACNPPIRAGKAVMYRLLDQAYAALAPGGGLYVVIRKQQGAPSAKEHLAQYDGAVETVARGGGFWVLRCLKGRVRLD